MSLGGLGHSLQRFVYGLEEASAKSGVSKVVVGRSGCDLLLDAGRE